MNTLIMGSYTDVKNLIISNIKANGQREITGPILQDVLLNMLENSSRVEEITYSDLKALRDEKKLTPSRLYRITDYVTTTVQANTKSAGHPFDVIVLALTESELSEQAWSIQHDGDEYFSNSNLSAWQIWYCLDNDINRFAWADVENGKGVIYRMIDEFDNDVPYDFKNIQFKHPDKASNYPHYYYTFASSPAEDNTDYSLSISNIVYSNKISPYYISNTQNINKILFIGRQCYINAFGVNCYNNAFLYGCYRNAFGNSCYGNVFDSQCNNNAFEDNCNSNALRNGCMYNTFGNSCYGNVLGNVCDGNTFGNSCYGNVLGNACDGNTLENNCNSNTFGDNCDDNSFGNNCKSNTFGNSFSNNTFGSGCSSNIFGTNCQSNSFGTNCYNNTFGSNCSSNTFGSNCRYIKFASNSSVSDIYNYYHHNHFGDGCQYIVFTGAETASDSSQVQNYNFAQGLQGTSSAYLTIDGKRNRAYETYISKDTDGTIKESVIAEFENRLGNCVDLTTEQTINAAKTFSAGIDLNGTRISKVGSPVNTDDAANKEYVDTQVKTVDDKVNDFKNAGYLYAGVAAPTTDPGTPDAKVFYIANGKGEYTNFGDLELTEDDVVILYYDTTWHKVATGIASNEKLADLPNYAHKDEVRHIERDLGMYPELEPVPLNPEVTGKYINSDGKYIDASGWNVASIGAVYLGNTYLLNMVSSANMVLGVALFVSRVYKRDKEGKIIGTTLTPLFSAKNTSIPASGYVLFEAMDDYDDVLICYKPELTTQMLVARWGFKASHATQLRNLRLIVDNKTDFEGIYELLTAGYALNLVGKGNGEPQAFMSRKTGGGNITDGSAVIKEVDGVKPIVWNQLIPRTYKSVTHNGVTYTVNDDGSIVANGTASEFSYCAVLRCYVFASRKYCVIGGADNSSSSTYFFGDGNNLNVTLDSIIIANPLKDATVTFACRVQKGVTVDNVKFTPPILIDLTQMFGAGNEPSTHEEYLDRISHYHIKDAYAYNAGEVVNYKGTGIKTTGRNLWDEEWESGRIEKGENVASSTYFRSKNFISVDPTKQYFIRAKDCFVSEYDANKAFIEQRRGLTDVDISLSSNCRYIRFWCFNQPTYNHDICINLSDPAFNGQYEPYKSYVRDWSEAMKKYFPDGMISLNGIKDFFNDKKAVRKFGVVDLGSLSYSKNNNVWISIIPDYKTNTQNGYVNAFTTKYTQTIANDEMTSVTCPNLKFYAEAGGVAGGIGIRDDAYTTAESFKAALAGVLLFYELSEPVEDIFEKPLNLTYTVINGGTETSLTTENSTQFEGSIAYNKDYVAVVDELQMQNRVIQIEFENWEN